MKYACPWKSRNKKRVAKKENWKNDRIRRLLYNLIMPSDKLIFISTLRKELLIFLGIKNDEIKVFRSKGLLSHLLKRKHYNAAKYLDYIPEILESPDYAGTNDGQIELIKCFKDNVFLSIKLDSAKNLYYVATLFDVSQSKIEAYCKSGRLKKLDKSMF